MRNAKQQDQKDENKAKACDKKTCKVTSVQGKGMYGPSSREE